MAWPAEAFTSEPFGRRREKRETVAATGLLDQRRITQGLKDAARISAHVILNGQDKTGSQLAQGSSGTGKGGGVGEKLLGVSSS